MTDLSRVTTWRTSPHVTALWCHNMTDLSDVTTWRTSLTSQHGGLLWRHNMADFPVRFLLNFNANVLTWLHQNQASHHYNFEATQGLPISWKETFNWRQTLRRTPLPRTMPVSALHWMLKNSVEWSSWFSYFQCTTNDHVETILLIINTFPTTNGMFPRLSR